MDSQWKDKIWGCTENNFEELSLDIFRFQYDNNIIYRQFVDALGVSPGSVSNLSQIPFLPIRFFKSHSIKTTAFEPITIFESSGTTGMIPSRHEVKDVALYKESFTKAFELFYGDPADWCIIGLLPSYLERNNSSLIVMVDELIRLSEHSSSGFYLNEVDKLHLLLKELEFKKQKTLLIGVTFALLDFAEQYPMHLHYTTIMETGGMKGRRKDLIREEVQEILKNAFQVDTIHSEYGMTELLSQAYSKGQGRFECPPWMKVMVRDEEDPLTVRVFGKGAMNVIDLANIYSCSFIATDDAGQVFNDKSFEVAGRIDNSDIRGCSLLAL